MIIHFASKLYFNFRSHNDPCDPSVLSEIFHTSHSEKSNNSIQEQQEQNALIYILVSNLFFFFQTFFLLICNCKLG